MTLPARATIVEVGPRDGLQNEPEPVALADKLELVDRLAGAGLAWVEATSFVSPKAVPQLADGDVLVARMARRDGVRYPVLVPNLKGYDRALAAGEVTDIAVFTAASESFNQRNINASIAESIERFEPVVEAARRDGVGVRAYVSCAFGCPFEGPVEPASVHEVGRRLFELGVDALSIGDTIGVGVPAQVAPICAPLVDEFGAGRIGLHLHDTRGTALSNVWAGLELGVSTFDSSVGGLGGCPFAPGATGNLATEDLVWFLERNGVSTGVDLDAVIETAHWITSRIGKPVAGHIAGVRRFP